MKIYIKKNLREIPIVKQLVNLLGAYNTTYSSDLNDLDSLYEWRVKNDPVYRFLDYAIPNENEETREGNINYLAHSFYTVKGTFTVFNLLTQYNIINLGSLEEPLFYNGGVCTIRLTSTPEGIDRDRFCKYFEEFLGALLYFLQININIDDSSFKFLDNFSGQLTFGGTAYTTRTLTVDTTSFYD